MSHARTQRKIVNFMESIYQKIEELQKRNGTGALCVVISTSGSTPGKTGAKMIVYSDGSIFGTIGGGSVEKEVTEKALELMKSGKPEKFSFCLEEDFAMHCGGNAEVYIEPIMPLHKLYIFGAGHIGRAVMKFAKELDFMITVFDSRENIFSDDEFKSCNCINDDYLNAIENSVFDDNTFCVIVTPKHSYDEEILIKLSKMPHAYLGMIGSDRKVAILKRKLLDEKIISMEEIEKIDMPIGIKFVAETPAEIAISIVAKLVDVKNTLIQNK